jgi:histidinol-phosphate aminotransferase
MVRAASSGIAWPYWLPLRPDLKGISPYGAPQIEGVIALNTNENPFELPVEVVEAISSKIAEGLKTLNRYPDRDAIELRAKLAAYITASTGVEVSADNIWAANGSNEILQTLFLACGGAQNIALGFTPSYSVHPLIAQITKTPWVAGSRSEHFAIDIAAAKKLIAEKNPKLVFLTTPNNPSGTLTSLDEIKELAQAAEKVDALLIVDEAYAEFSRETSAVTLIEQFPHVVVVRTMSKAFAFAGARLGYLVAHPAVVNAALITRLPYHLSSLVQAAASVALDFGDRLRSEVETLISERERVASAISEVGMKAEASEANFILFSGFSGESHDVWQFFLDRGILIRDNGLRGYLRVTIGTPEENDRFIAALRELALPDTSK